MDKFTSVSRLSIYDSLAILFPGYLICYLVEPLAFGKNNCMPCNDELYNSLFHNSISDWLIIGLTSLIIGLVWNKLMEIAMNSCLRNNPEHIESELKCVEKELKISSQQLLSKLRVRIPYSQQQDTLSDYYAAYYYLWEKNKLGSIPTLEKQVALLRNILFIFPIFILKCFSENMNIDVDFTLIAAILILVAFLLFISSFILCCYNFQRSCWKMLPLICLSISSFVFCCCIDLCLGVPVFLISIMLILTTIILIQRKIYHLVWEGYLFS